MNNTKSLKKVQRILCSHGGHWVGNGFPVRTLFAYPDLGQVVSPFLMLDYAGPMEFPLLMNAWALVSTHIVVLKR